MTQLKMSKNPALFLQNNLFQNPQLQQAMSYVKTHGGNAKEAFLTLAKEQGVDPAEILNMLR